MKYHEMRNELTDELLWNCASLSAHELTSKIDQLLPAGDNNVTLEEIEKVACRIRWDIKQSINSRLKELCDKQG